MRSSTHPLQHLFYGHERSNVSCCRETTKVFKAAPGARRLADARYARPRGVCNSIVTHWRYNCRATTRIWQTKKMADKME